MPANDDRPRTMHADAEHTRRDRLPPVVANLLERNDHRRHRLATQWQWHTMEARAREAAYERVISMRDGVERTADLSRDLSSDGLEL
jgi:hypothetical protein